MQCEKCEFTTTRKDKLKTHIESKHYQNKVKCPECPTEFTRNDNLERHVREYHPKDPLALTPIGDWAEHVERELSTHMDIDPEVPMEVDPSTLTPNMEVEQLAVTPEEPVKSVEEALK